MAKKAYLGAQVSREFFEKVKIKLIQRNETGRQAIIRALCQYLGIDGAEEEINQGGVNNDEEQQSRTVSAR